MASAAMRFIRSETGPMTTHFWGPVANWGIVLSAAYDSYYKGPEIISLPMTGTMIVYSGLFMRFAWAVQPRNYLLLACHTFNVTAQSNQLRRALEYKLETEKNARAEIEALGKRAAAGGAAVATMIAVRNPLHAACMNSTGPARALAEWQAGPFYIHFWAPTFKWMLSVANLMDLNRPVEKVSLSQQASLTATGIIWSRYSMVINPVNYNLMIVNIALAASSGYHLSRKLMAEYGSGKSSK
uniref:Mitochondrial pyruvate carrier n=1 Tax=Rhizochromulina marina TaxID=1034831 RepID=A0A7S2RP81_9STRA